MTRRSIEFAAKAFIWALFALFLFAVAGVLAMMGLL